MIGLGIGIQTPEAKRVGSDSPQPVIFQAGPGWMLVDNVTPSALVTKVASALLFTGYEYFFLLCLYPAARLWHSKCALHQALWLMNFYLASVWVACSVLLISICIVLYDWLRMSFQEAIVRLLSWSVLYGISLYALGVLLLFFGILIRPFWEAFRTLFALSRFRFVGCLLVSWALGYFLSTRWAGRVPDY